MTVDQPTLNNLDEGEAAAKAVVDADLDELAHRTEREQAEQRLAVTEPAESIATDVPSKWTAAMRLAGRIHDTPFVSRAMRGKPHYVLACILFGDELGIGPMQSLASIHVIDGRPAASPELMRALVNRAGHRLDVVEKTGEKVTLRGVRADTGSTAEVTFTMEDAKRAGLAGKDNWKNYPRAMLMARATSELCRDIFSDVIAGLSYTPEEAASIDGGTWTPEQVDAATGEIIEA